MLLNKYFDDLFRKMNLAQFESRFMDLDFEVMEDIHVLKIALFNFVYKVLNGRTENCQINFSLFN